jgi:hypothetical protein
MLRRVAGCVHHVDDDIAERHPVAVLDRTRRKGHIRPSVQDIFGPDLAREGMSGGKMIGVDVSIGDEANAHARLIGHPQIRPDVADGIDDGAGGVAAAAEQIRDCHRICVQELAQHHWGSLTGEIHSINLLIDP